MEKNFNILLEYSEEQKCFHHNYLDKNGRPSDTPSPVYRPIGLTNFDIYMKFVKSVTYEETFEEMKLKYNKFLKTNRL